MYALARLEESGETANLRARHASVMATLAEQVIRNNFAMTDAHWNQTHRGDSQDILAGFEHAVAQQDARIAGRTALALRLMDVRRGTFSGMMNVSAMVAVTVAITTERFVPRAARVMGVAAVAAGLLMIGQAASA